MRHIALLLALLLPEAPSIGAAPAVQVEWSRELWAGHGAASGGVAVSDDGSVFVVGTSRVGPGDTDLTLWRLDAHGKVQWRRRLGGPRPDPGTAVAIAPDGDVIVAGDSMSLLVHGEKRHGNPDLLTARYSADGSLKWVRRQGRCGPTYASSVSTNGRVVVVTGSHQGSDTPCRARPNSAWYAPVSAVVVAYSPTGGKLWTRALQPDGGGDAVAAAAVVDTNGDVYVTGRSMSWYGRITARLFAARLSPEGVPVWTRTFLRHRRGAGPGRHTGGRWCSHCRQRRPRNARFLAPRHAGDRHA